MKESLRQQAGHRPGPSTGSRQAAQSCGSATSAASRNIARTAAPSRANRLAGISAASISPCMVASVSPPAANLNGAVRVKKSDGTSRRL